jgi:hypothetical protein
MENLKRHLGVILVVVAAVLCAMCGAIEASPSPVGQWEFVLSGVKQGTAFLEFTVENTNPGYVGLVSGYILCIPAGGSTGKKDQTVVYGFAALNGLWHFDQQGHVVGFLYNPPEQTVRFDITSFKGTLANASLNLIGQHADGNIIFTGVPSAQYKDLTGAWTIERIAKQTLIFAEIMVAAPDSSMGNNNLYDLSGEAADTCTFGFGALYRNDSFAVALWEYAMPKSENCADVDLTSAPEMASAAIGKINLNTGQAQLTGNQGSGIPVKISMPVYCE